MIIKSFATVTFITKIDDTMANTLPPSVFQNAKDLNKNNPLKMGQDHNTFKKIFRN